MTFACILALMGIWAFVLSENILCLIPVIVSIGIATREFEDLKENLNIKNYYKTYKSAYNSSYNELYARMNANKIVNKYFNILTI